MKDEVITALWRIKDEIGREHGYDLARLAATVRQKEQSHTERLVNWSKKRSAVSSPSDQQA